MYSGICEAIHKEMDILDQRYSNGTAMSNGDLDMIDKMAHTLKSLAALDAMRGYESPRRRYDEYRRY